MGRDLCAAPRTQTSERAGHGPDSRRDRNEAITMAATMTITQACGHKRRVSLSGTATTRSARAHEVAMRECARCEDVAAAAAAVGAGDTAASTAITESPERANEPVTCPACLGSGEGAAVASGLDVAGVPWVFKGRCPTCRGCGRVFLPEQQLAHVRADLARAQASRRHEGRIWEIRSAAAQLAVMEARHAHGELAPVPANDCPF